MIYLVILVVMLVAFTAVGWPLVTNSGGTQRDSRVVFPLDDLINRRDAVYRGIKELDFEHELGNLSESDYRGLRQRYRSEAAATLRSLDAAAGGPAPSTGPSPAVSSQTELPCPSCGKPVEAGDRHCWSCGEQQGRHCTNCGGPAEPEHQFCAGCGARLEAEA